MMAPLRCLTYGSIAVGHLANQKRVRQARDQRSVTQLMRRKLAGTFCFVVLCFFKSHGPIIALGFFYMAIGEPKQKQILPRRFFGVSFRDAAAQKLNHSQKRKRSG